MASGLDYIDKAELYLEEGKQLSKPSVHHISQAERGQREIRAQNHLLGSIAASLIALAKK
jgi:hypothetical protein